MSETNCVICNEPETPSATHAPATCALNLRSRLSATEAALEEARRNGRYICEAFVAGASWWEVQQTGGTMWGSDRTRAEKEAERRFPTGEWVTGPLVARLEAAVLSAESALAAEREAHEETKRKLTSAYEVIAIDNAVCLCGCPISEHEDYGEYGEQCEHEEDECIRVASAVLEIVGRIRLALETAQRERDEATRVLRDIATFGWYAKGAKVARAYLATKEKG